MNTFVLNTENLFENNHLLAFVEDEKCLIIRQTGGYAPREWLRQGTEGGGIVRCRRVGWDTAGMMWGDSPHHTKETEITEEEALKCFTSAQRLYTLSRSSAREKVRISSNGN